MGPVERLSDGTYWQPVISAFDTRDAGTTFHFQAQISDGSVIAEEYYNENNSGLGLLFQLPPPPLGEPSQYTNQADGATGKYGMAAEPAFGPAFTQDPRNPSFRFGRFDNARPKIYRLPFSPRGAESLTRFASNVEGPADPSLREDKNSPAVGKFTHPASAPDNNLLTVWSPGPVNHQNFVHLPTVHGGIYP